MLYYRLVAATNQHDILFRVSLGKPKQNIKYNSHGIFKKYTILFETLNKEIFPTVAVNYKHDFQKIKSFFFWHFTNDLMIEGRYLSSLGYFSKADILSLWGIVVYFHVVIIKGLLLFCQCHIHIVGGYNNILIFHISENILHKIDRSFRKWQMVVIEFVLAVLKVI